jgi:Domain of unknown function (DUF397)
VISNELPPDLSSANWRKSSRSQQMGQCVEVARADTIRAVRDSKDPSADTLLLFTSQEWATFITAVRAGRLDVN